MCISTLSGWQPASSAFGGPCWWKTSNFMKLVLVSHTASLCVSLYYLSPWRDSPHCNPFLSKHFIFRKFMFFLFFFFLFLFCQCCLTTSDRCRCREMTSSMSIWVLFKSMTRTCSAVFAFSGNEAFMMNDVSPSSEHVFQPPDSSLCLSNDSKADSLFT